MSDYEQPIPYTVCDLFGELERQVKEERERQHNIVWEFPQGGFANHRRCHSARHAKRLAGWPSGEWQGIREAT